MAAEPRGRLLLLRYLLAQRPWRLLEPDGLARLPQLEQAWLTTRLEDPRGFDRWLETARALPRPDGAWPAPADPFPDRPATRRWAAWQQLCDKLELTGLARQIPELLFEIEESPELAGWLHQLGCLRGTEPPRVAWSLLNGALNPAGEAMAELQQAITTLRHRMLIETGAADPEQDGYGLPAELLGLVDHLTHPGQGPWRLLGRHLELWGRVPDPELAQLAALAWPELFLAWGMGWSSGPPEILLLREADSAAVLLLARLLAGRFRRPEWPVLWHLDLGPAGALPHEVTRLFSLATALRLPILLTGIQQSDDRWWTAPVPLLVQDPTGQVAHRLELAGRSYSTAQVHLTPEQQARIEPVLREQQHRTGRPLPISTKNIQDLGALRVMAAWLRRADAASRIQELQSAQLHTRHGLQLLRDPEGVPLVLHPATEQAVEQFRRQLLGRRAALHLEGIQRLADNRPVVLLLEGEHSVMQLKVLARLAPDLGRQLLELDVSRILSKYIGETEGRLREIFAEAEQSGCGLFLDHAENLLTRRTEQRTSIDRYASMQVGYLLLQLEQFKGVLVLRTTRPGDLDPSVMRRVSHRIDFRPLEAAQRVQLWQALVPEQAAVEPGIDWPALGEELKLDVNQTQKALFHAALHAAAAGGALSEQLLRASALREQQQTG